MEQNFEQDIPLHFLIIGFIILMVLSNIIKKAVLRRKQIREGQVLTTESGRVLSIEERVSGNPAWALGQIRSEGKTQVILGWISAAALNLMLTVPFIKSLSNPTFKAPAIIFLGIFSIFASGFTAFVIRLTIRQLRYGVSICKIQGKAGIVGKTIKGIIQNNFSIKATGDYVIEIQCIETYYTGSGKNRTSHTATHFQAKQTIPAKGQNTKIGINFSFDIPNYAPETGYQLSRGDINWQLRITAATESIEYMALFVIPVFRTDFSSEVQLESK